MTNRFVFALLLGVGCGGDDGVVLDRDGVTSIPAGTGQGSAASGRWQGTLTTMACSGTCLVSGTFSLCDVGDIDRYDLDIVQTDGHLVIEAEGLTTPSLMGGIDADGEFHVGGYATELGGQIEALSETIGQLTGDTFTGTVIASTVGSYDGEDFACNAEYATHGERDAD